MSLLIRLYPRRWQDRYGAEFAALLEERPLGPFDVADIVLAAIDAHLHLRGRDAPSERRKGFPMSLLRIGGIAAMIAGVIPLAGVAGVALAPSALDGGGLILVPLTIAMLIAFVGLSAFQARTHPRLVWAAVALPAIGSVASIVGMVLLVAAPDRALIGGISGWEIWFVGLLATLLGASLFGIATYLTRVLSRLGSLLLALTAPLAVAVLFGSFGRAESILSIALGLTTVAAFSAAWLLLGWTAVRLDRPAAQVTPA